MVLEWIVGLGFGLLVLYVAQRPPFTGRSHCDIEVVQEEGVFEVIVDNRYGVEVTASFDWLVSPLGRGRGPTGTPATSA